MEQSPSIMRVIGGTEEERERLALEIELASQKTGKEMFGEYLIEPNEEERFAIQDAVEYANRVALHYGAEKMTDPERVFLLKPGSVEARSDGDIAGGVNNSFNQSIGVDQKHSNILLASTIIHESFHMSSMHGSQIFKDGKHGLHRSGIEMRGREKEGKYFSIAQEAIIATLVQRFFDEEVAHSLLYREEMLRTKKIKEWLIARQEMLPEVARETLVKVISNISILENNKTTYELLCESNEEEDKYKFGYFFGSFEKELKSGHVILERSDEREIFNTVLDRIISDSNGKIRDKNELFDEFARAHFTGNYLPLARIIDSALGVGSFRKIAIELGEMNTQDI